MKNLLFKAISCGVLAISLLSSCAKDPKDDPSYLYNVNISLDYIDDSVIKMPESAVITVKNTVTGAVAEFKMTGTKGTAKVVAGLYDFSATATSAAEGDVFVYNGIKSGVKVVKDSWDESGTVSIPMTGSRSNQVVIKELYCTGCPKDDGSGSFSHGAYVILYNNSEYEADLSGIHFAFIQPYNSNASNADIVDGKLIYDGQGGIPAGSGCWTWGVEAPKLAPGKQVVVAISSAINNTTTYSQAPNLANAEYYAMYAPESQWNNATYYPAPADVIPSTHYLEPYIWGQGTAWTLSNTCPAFFIFVPTEDMTAFTSSTANVSYLGGKETAANLRKKVSNSWVKDAIEVFNADQSVNNKRFTSDLDAGSIAIKSKLGYTIYRNVDKAKTEAIATNKDKLVYNYAGGAEGTTDPSGIDAEASIKNGALIIYQDTNNSSNDFHIRKVSSLK